MGYTHYWNFKGPVDKDTMMGWGKAFPCLRDILKRHGRIICHEYNYPSTPPFLDEFRPKIRFNGKQEDGHETFSVDLEHTEKFQFCKTARKSYDLPVCEALLVLRWHIPGFTVSSDGDGGGGLETWDENWPEAAKNVERLYGVRFTAGKEGIIPARPRNAGAAPSRPRNAGASRPRWECPKCHGTKLRVCVSAWAELVQGGPGDAETSTTSDSLDDRSHEWDEGSSMVCIGCGRAGKVSEFSTVKKKAAKGA